MAFSKQPLSRVFRFKAIAPRFWRWFQQPVHFQSNRQKQYHSRRRWRLVLLGLLALLLTLISVPSAAQTSPVEQNKVPVVLDGRVLFEVGNFGTGYRAAKRAEIINNALKEEVQSPQLAEIVVVREDDLIALRSRQNQRHLLTVREEDTLEGPNSLSQANFWRKTIEDALRRGQLERTSTYYRKALMLAVGVVLGAIAVHVSLLFFRKWASHRLSLWLNESTSPLHSWEQSARLLLKLALLGVQAGLWTAVAFYLTDLFPQTRSWRYELFNFLPKLFNFLNSPVINLGNSNYSALQMLLLLGLTVGLWFAVSFVTKLFKSYVLGRTGAEPRVQEVIAVLTQYTLTFLGLIVLLQIWGLDVGSLTILASVLGVGIGFGVQNIANNFISGLIITFERPIQVGDFVKVGELLGTVERIGARSTEICTLDQVTMIVPNSRFLESEVINWSHGNPISRLRIPIGVAYGSDVKKVQMALIEAAKSHPEVLLQPHPQVWFQGFGDSSLNFDLLVWIGDPKRQFKIKSDLNYRIEETLRCYELEVPFPQRDLHLRSPQLDALMGAWLQQQTPMLSLPQQTEAPNGDQPSVEYNYTPENPLDDTVGSAEPLSEQLLTSTVVKKELTYTDIEALVKAMRESGGLEIKDRSYRLNIYPNCFIGAQAVEWLVQQQKCSRKEAIALGQFLIDRGIIHHVLDERSFQDDYSFYRFYVDER
ncbi:MULTISPECIES: mechanosensitive ion channel domain-containing protein [unclassified Coleofasciculus]|uniref:mechanosensitive ion channel domain-containing protein n=1 Tax=unclassified Coleofasciculus TaxID=2692782 RepID=UPI001881191B|nr:MULTISPECIES: mechanosensitive ion channel domain-containing protein [unclassified Coleofasciculus]MBE9125415.1 mechanosensitive ion channel [Coleofasciculus sp. LEGE 07081]MBE9147368.1 mechanosensitive ion channel [Coleofasciculus sp. LEGE 07092]